MKIRGSRSSDQRDRAEAAGNAVDGGEHIQASNSVGNHMVDHDLGEASVREAMGASADAFFDRADRTLHFTDVAVRGDAVEMDVVKVVANASKFVISVNVDDGETS